MEAYEIQKNTHGLSTDLIGSLNGQNLLPPPCQLLSAPLTATLAVPAVAASEMLCAVHVVCDVHATWWGV